MLVSVREYILCRTDWNDNGEAHKRPPTRLPPTRLPVPSHVIQQKQQNPSRKKLGKDLKAAEVFRCYPSTTSPPAWSSNQIHSLFQMVATNTLLSSYKWTTDPWGLAIFQRNTGLGQLNFDDGHGGKGLTELASQMEMVCSRLCSSLALEASCFYSSFNRYSTA